MYMRNHDCQTNSVDFSRYGNHVEDMADALDDLIQGEDQVSYLMNKFDEIFSENKEDEHIQ